MGHQCTLRRRVKAAEKAERYGDFSRKATVHGDTDILIQVKNQPLQVFRFGQTGNHTQPLSQLSGVFIELFRRRRGCIHAFHRVGRIGLKRIRCGKVPYSLSCSAKASGCEIQQYLYFQKAYPSGSMPFQMAQEPAEETGSHWYIASISLA